MSRPARGVAGLALASAVAWILLQSGHASASTWYVRPDGGTAEQCDGTADAPYVASRAPSGATTPQRCAWSHPFVALPPLQPPRIAGGDTVIIRSGSYRMGAGAPGADGCADRPSHECVMTPPPSGPSPTTPTRLLGQGHDAQCPKPPQLWADGGAQAVVQLTGSDNIELACLELTDHSPCIRDHNRNGGAGTTARCDSDSARPGPWGENGIVATDSSSVLLRQLDIHGLAGNGIRAGRLRDWTLDRVTLRANGWAGWDGNVDSRGKGASAGSSNSGTLRFSGVEIAWNGCGERWPGKEIFGCWAQQQGGYGDGLGTARTGGDWVFEDVRVHHNTSDGLDLLYLDGTGSVTIRRLLAEGNAGNQVKTAGPLLLENSVLLGNCAYFAGMAGSNLGPDDHCRAMGNTLSVSLLGDSQATVRHNTLAGQGDCLLITVGGGRGARTLVQNNAFIGGPEWSKGSSGGGLTCGHYAEGSEAQVAFDRNLFWQVKRDQCPPGSVCGADPMLTLPEYGRFDATPLAGSALLDNAAPSEVDTDYKGRPRPVGGSADIGAIERPLDAGVAMPTGAAVNGTAVDDTAIDGTAIDGSDPATTVPAVDPPLTTATSMPAPASAGG